MLVKQVLACREMVAEEVLQVFTVRWVTYERVAVSGLAMRTCYTASRGLLIRYNQRVRDFDGIRFRLHHQT
jgi:hypothetical protein